MGTGRWSADDWSSYATTTKTKSRDAIFKNNALDDKLNPLNIKIRESRDSPLNPQSNAIIVGVDVTGSMGMLAELIVKEGLGIFMKEILDRKPVTDPHVLFAAIGDVNFDRSPIQLTEFETDLTVTKQLEKFHIEQGGGGNDSESYTVPWFFAANATSIDCFEKRKNKGFLFTIGDELCPKILKKEHIKKFLNIDVEKDYDADELYAMASRMYHVFHIVVEEGSFARGRKQEVLKSWQKVMGQNVIALSDYKKLAEVLVSTIQVISGENVDKVCSSWSGNTSVVVRNAVNGLSTVNTKNDLVRF